MTGAREAFKLMRVRKGGTAGPLFINRRQVITAGQWLQAEAHPTKGFAVRPGWHVTLAPVAPHLRQGGDRAWFRVLVQDCEEIRRPESQGGTWLLAQRMMVLGPLEEAGDDRARPVASESRGQRG